MLRVYFGNVLLIIYAVKKKNPFIKPLNVFSHMARLLHGLNVPYLREKKSVLGNPKCKWKVKSSAFYKEKIAARVVLFRIWLKKAIFALLGWDISKSWSIGNVWTTESFLGHINPLGSPGPVIRYKYCQRMQWLRLYF